MCRLDVRKQEARFQGSEIQVELPAERLSQQEDTCEGRMGFGVRQGCGYDI